MTADVTEVASSVEEKAAEVVEVVEETTVE